MRDVEVHDLLDARQRESVRADFLPLPQKEVEQQVHHTAMQGPDDALVRLSNDAVSS